MNKTAESFTKFRTVSQARIKSAQKIDYVVPQTADRRYRNLSVKDLNKGKYSNINPQTQRPPEKAGDYDKKSIVKAQIQTAANTNANSMYPLNGNFLSYETPRKNVGQNVPARSKNAQYGRNLQYPVDRPEQRYQKQIQNQPELKKSFSSSHYKDPAAKSRKIIEDKQMTKEKFQKAFQYLLSTNKKYLEERQRLCCQKAKPTQQIFHIPLANLLSTYQDHYPPKDAHLDAGYYPEPQNKKQAFGLPETKVCGNSTSHQFHNGKQQKRPDLATWPQGFKLQGPIWGPTTYMNHYPNHGDFEKMVPIAVWDKAQTGLDFVGDSNHRQSYKDPKSGPAKLATWNNMHPYGNDFNRQPQTTYDHHHNSKQRHPINNHKPYEYPIFKNPGKFNSEYNDEYKDKNNEATNAANKCKC